MQKADVSVNLMQAREGSRLLFMPYSSSEGVYVAMVLNDSEFSDPLGKLREMSTSSGGTVVKKVNIKNNLFMDFGTLSVNLQKILKSYEMIVIARIRGYTT